MAGNCTPLFNKEIFFLPDASSQHSYAYLPAIPPGESIELAVYILFSHGTTAGKVQVQSAPYHDYPNSNAWANEGSTIDWAAEDSTKVGRLTGMYGAARLDISTAVANGTIRAWVMASSRT